MAPSLPARRVLPGPRPTPLLGRRGNALAFYRDPLGYVGGLQERYGELVGLVQADPSFVFVLGPAGYAQLLAQPARFPSVLRLSDPAPPAWRLEQLPAVALERYLGDLAAQTGAMLDRWGVGQLVDVAYVMQRLTLRVSAQSLLGLTGPDEVAQAGATLAAWSDRLWTRSGAAGPLHPLPGRAAPHAEAVKRLIGVALERRASAAPAPDSSTLLDALLTPPNGQADAALVEQLAELLAVGCELTAAALSWTLLLLSQHPAIMTDLGAELSGRLHGASPTLADLDRAGERLPLLDRVVRESLRLLPPQSLELRRVGVPTLLDGYQLPAGALVLACPYLTQRLPEVYFAPDRFRPERWPYVEPSPAEFAPFGAVSDLSSGLAMLQLKAILAQLLQRYRLALAPGVRIDRAARLTLVPRPGLPMIITSPDRPLIKRAAHGTIREMVALG